MSKPSTTTTKLTAQPQSDLLRFVTSEQVSEAIKSAGCAVTAIEQDGAVRLHSASHGIGFQVLWGNAQAPAQYVDFTLSCPLRVQGGTLPEGVVAGWHRGKRFARVAQHGDFVVLEMDVIVAGGVSPAHLTLNIQLWTQMMGQFFLHLRNYRASEGGDTAQVDAAKTELATSSATPSEPASA